MGVFSKIFHGLKKTKEAISSKIKNIFVGELDEDFFEELEYILVSSDMGAQVANEVVEQLRAVSKKKKIKTMDEFTNELKLVLKQMLDIKQPNYEYPVAITFIGVNGVGKTTAIGKLAHQFKKDKKQVLMVAADTFRAAASDQLTEWSKRAGVRIVKYSEGADPSAVVFDGLSSAVAKKDDVVLIDTAGRLQNKVGLMEELKKIHKTENKVWEDRQQLHYLVIDATTGQNALSQVELFHEAIGIDGVILTKLDGTAKGGIVFKIAKEYHIPVVYIGVGEGIEDLERFDSQSFVDNIL